MTAKIASLLVLLVASIAHAGRHDRDAIVLDRKELLGELTRLDALLSSMMAREHSPQVRSQLQNARNQNRALREEVEDAPSLGDPKGRQGRSGRYVVDVDSSRWQNPAAPVALPPPGRPTTRAISDQTFSQLMAAIAAESFGSNQLRIVQQAAGSHFFLTWQVRQIVGRLSFSKDKLTAVTALKPRLLDPENAFQLYQDFTFSSDKDELRRILGG